MTSSGGGQGRRKEMEPRTDAPPTKRRSPMSITFDATVRLLTRHQLPLGKWQECVDPGVQVVHAKVSVNFASGAAGQALFASSHGDHSIQPPANSPAPRNRPLIDPGRARP